MNKNDCVCICNACSFQVTACVLVVEQFMPQFVSDSEFRVQCLAAAITAWFQSLQQADSSNTINKRMERK